MWDGVWRHRAVGMAQNVSEHGQLNWCQLPMLRHVLSHSNSSMTLNPIPHSEYTIRLWLESIPKVGWGGAGRDTSWKRNPTSFASRRCEAFVCDQTQLIILHVFWAYLQLDDVKPIPHSKYTMRLWLESIPKVGWGGGKQRWGGSGYELKTKSHIFCSSKVWSFCITSFVSQLFSLNVQKMEYCMQSSGSQWQPNVQ